MTTRERLRLIRAALKGRGMRFGSIRKELRRIGQAMRRASLTRRYL